MVANVRPFERQRHLATRLHDRPRDEGWRGTRSRTPPRLLLALAPSIFTTWVPEEVIHNQQFLGAMMLVELLLWEVCWNQRCFSLLGRDNCNGRRRSSRVLRLVEREEISRGIAAGYTIRAIARSLNRAASAVSQLFDGRGRRLFAIRPNKLILVRPNTLVMMQHKKLVNVRLNKLI